MRLTVTAKGRGTLANDPLNELAAAIESLLPAQHGALAEGLDELLRTLLTRRAQGAVRAGGSRSTFDTPGNGVAAD